jgi:thiol-disulfide isomerase/thioredoxin
MAARQHPNRRFGQGAPGPDARGLQRDQDTVTQNNYENPTPESDMANQWRRLLIGALAIYIVAASVFLLTGGGSSQDQNQGETKNTELKLTQDLYSLEFITLDGVTTSFADYAGAPLIVNFFASWCTPCVKEMPDFQRLHEGSGERFQIIGLAVEGERPARRIVESTGVTYPIGLDDTDLLVQLGGVAMPTTVFISKQGELLESHSGVLDYANLISRTEKLFSDE